MSLFFEWGVSPFLEPPKVCPCWILLGTDLTDWLNEIGDRPVLFRQLTIYVAVFLTAQRTEAGAATEGGSVRTERLANGGRRLTNWILLYFFLGDFLQAENGLCGVSLSLQPLPSLRFTSLSPVAASRPSNPCRWFGRKTYTPMCGFLVWEWRCVTGG